MAKKHVFLSYCRDNANDARRLHEALVNAGEPMWWDQDILPGQDWKFEIRKAMRDAYAVLLCLSEETSKRTTSGIYPEALDAINMLREYPPGDIFLIPVRFSECDIPMIEIDGTRTLDRLQFVDLFPAAQWDAGLQKLVRALQASPHHPPISAAVPTATSTTQAAPAPSQPPNPAVAIWKQKLEYLQTQEAISADPSQKFAMQQQIEEAKRKIQELS